MDYGCFEPRTPSKSISKIARGLDVYDRDIFVNRRPKFGDPFRTRKSPGFSELNGFQMWLCKAFVPYHTYKHKQLRLAQLDHFNQVLKSRQQYNEDKDENQKYQREKDIFKRILVHMRPWNLRKQENG